MYIRIWTFDYVQWRVFKKRLFLWLIVSGKIIQQRRTTYSGMAVVVFYCNIDKKVRWFMMTCNKLCVKSISVCPFHDYMYGFVMQRHIFLDEEFRSWSLWIWKGALGVVDIRVGGPTAERDDRDSLYVKLCKKNIYQDLQNMYLTSSLVKHKFYWLMGGALDGWNGWMNGVCGWVHIDGWMGGWMDGWMDGWKDGWMDGWVR